MRFVVTFGCRPFQLLKSLKQGSNVAETGIMERYSNRITRYSGHARLSASFFAIHLEPGRKNY